jgi:isocitrate dehydrogenase kinase/phosphatase
LGNARVRQAFLKHHADLLDPGFWNDNKQRILAGEMPDIFPYDVQRRFGFLRRDSGWVRQQESHDLFKAP